MIALIGSSENTRVHVLHVAQLGRFLPGEVHAHGIERIGGADYLAMWLLAEFDRVQRYLGIVVIEGLDATPLLEALQAIAESEGAYAKKAVSAGAAGIVLAIANPDETVLMPEEYARVP